MENRSSGLWIGLGLGAILGALIQRYACSSQGEKMKNSIGRAFRKGSREAENFVDKAKEKAWEAGTKMADKVAEGTYEVAEKVDGVKDKVHAMASDAKK